ncbi:MAG: M24 family metallopeptidase [Planctomycetota bacterium]
MPHQKALLAGIADKNPTLFRRLGVALGDPAAWVGGEDASTAIVRDLEMDRVRQFTSADHVGCPADYAPQGGLDADRETATAQAVAEYCVREGIASLKVDRTLPFIYAWHLTERGIELRYDANFGVVDRRQKSEKEIELLSQAQSVTEEVMRLICERIASCDVSDTGELIHGGDVLTSEAVQSLAATEFLSRDFSMSHGAIVATAPQVADCHHRGTGPLRSGVPVIVDLFPMNQQTRYWGDCTRTVVHGKASATVQAMHAAVVAAKAASESKLVPGNSAESVHVAGEEVLKAAGFKVSRGTITDEPSIQHGTGHGIGLEVHEPILLDHGGGEMLDCEVFTVEPGLYGREDGGIRVEDMLVARPDGPQNLNRLPDGLDWLP